MHRRGEKVEKHRETSADTETSCKSVVSANLNNNLNNSSTLTCHSRALAGEAKFENFTKLSLCRNRHKRVLVKAICRAVCACVRACMRRLCVCVGVCRLLFGGGEVLFRTTLNRHRGSRAGNKDARCFCHRVVICQPGRRDPAHRQSAALSGANDAFISESFSPSCCVGSALREVKLED